MSDWRLATGDATRRATTTGEATRTNDGIKKMEGSKIEGPNYVTRMNQERATSDGEPRREPRREEKRPAAPPLCPRPQEEENLGKSWPSGSSGPSLLMPRASVTMSKRSNHKIWGFFGGILRPRQASANGKLDNCV